MNKLKKSIIFKGLLIFAAIIAVSFLTPVGRTTAKTLIILPEFIPNSPVKTINLFTSQPVIKEVEFASGSRTIYADLWLPKKQGKFPAAVLHLGIDVDKKDPRVQKLANSFARTGVATIVPNIPSLGRRRVLTEAKGDLMASFKYLKSLTEVDSSRIGFIGFCASGGLVILAAEEPKIAEEVVYVVTVNPYYDLNNLYKNITLRQIEDRGETHDWNPNFKTIGIYNLETIEGVESAEDRKILRDHLVFISTIDPRRN
jgi:hypothetical protein